jgi:hypothetical protein
LGLACLLGASDVMFWQRKELSGANYIMINIQTRLTNFQDEFRAIFKTNEAFDERYVCDLNARRERRRGFLLLQKGKLLILKSI